MREGGEGNREGVRILVYDVLGQLQEAYTDKISLLKIVSHHQFIFF